jgi:GTP pyrophosphokinase
MKSDEILKAAKALGLSSLEDLFVEVGFGKLSPHQVVNRLVPDKAAEEVETFKIRKPVKEQKGVTIKGIDNVLYHTAKCCFPIPGDNLAGFVTIGKGVTIHRKDCPNLERLVVEDARLVDVEWQTGEATANARLVVDTIDKPGILANLSALISSVNININHLEATTNQEKMGRITFIIEVKDISQLRTLIQKITQMEGVVRVKR